MIRKLWKNIGDSQLSTVSEAVKNNIKYGCMMACLEYDNSEIKKLFKKEDLCEEEGGFEDEKHVTLLYGFHDNVDSKEVIEVAKSFNYGEVRMNRVSAFSRTEDYDVIKFDITESVFYKVNKELRLKFPHTNKFPIYHAHATIAYVNGGKANFYINAIRKLVDGVPIVAKVTSLMYSDAKKHQTIEELEIV